MKNLRRDRMFASKAEKERYEKSGYKIKTPAKTYRTGKSGAIKRALKIR